MKPREFFRIMRNRQTKASKTRGHSPPNYTLDEFIQWLDAQPQLPAMWDSFVKSNYNKWLAPSVDRVNPDKGYYFKNMKLVTWRENHQRNIQYMKTSKRLVKPIASYTKDGILNSTFPSLKEAAKQVGSFPADIRKVINKVTKTNKPRTCKGFIWKWI